MELPIYIPKENYHIYKNLILSYPQINIVGFIPPIVTENLIKQILQNKDKKILNKSEINVPDFVKKKKVQKNFGMIISLLTHLFFQLKVFLRLATILMLTIKIS